MRNEYDKLLEQDDEVAAPAPGSRPQAEAQTNEYDELLRGDDIRSKSVMFGAVQQQPDTFAEATRLAKQTGLPGDVVMRNLDEVRQNVKLQDMKRKAALSPALREILSQPETAPMAHDDVEQLGQIEEITRAIKRGWQGVRVSAGGNTLQALEQSRSASSIDEVERMLAEGSEPGSIPQAVDPVGYQFMSAIGRQRVKQRIEAARGRAAERIATGNEAREALPADAGVQAALNAKTLPEFWEHFAADPVRFIAVVGAESLPAAATGIAASAAVAPVAGAAGVAAAMGGNSFAIEYGSTVVEQLRKRGVDVKDAEAIIKASKDPELLRDVDRIAAKRAAVVGAFDAVSGGLAGKTLVKSRLGNLALQMPLQGFLGAAGEGFGSLAIGDEVSFGAMAAEFFGELSTAPLDVAAATYSNRVEATAAKKQKAEAQAGRLQDLANAVINSKLRERSPETFAQFMQQAAAATGEDLENIYVDANALSESLAQSGIDPSEIPGVQEQLDEAMELGSPVRIKTGDFMAQLAGTDAEQALMQHIKVDPDDLTLAEASTAADEALSQFNTEADAAIAEKEGDQAFEDEVAEVGNTIREQLAGANRFTADVNEAYATLTQNFYAATASRLGITPKELYAKFPLQITDGSIPDPENQLNQAPVATDTPEFKEWFGESQAVDESGAPMVMYHGTGRSFDEFKAGTRAPGIFVTSDPTIADGFAAKNYDPRGEGRFQENPVNMPVFVKTDNPFDYDNPEHTNAIIAEVERRGGFEEPSDKSALAVGGFEAIESREVQRAIKKLGFDGFYVREDGHKNLAVLSPNQVKSAIGNRGTFDPSDPNILNQDQPEQDLFVGHNLSVENFRAAVELGGLAAPSLGISRTTTGGFDGYGGITLLAPSEIIEDGKARTFNADVYSPRQPRAQNQVDGKAFTKLVDELRTEHPSLDLPEVDNIESDGADGLARSEAVKMRFLTSQGIAPKPVKAKADPFVKKALKLWTGSTYELETNPKFVKLVSTELQSHIDRLSERFADDSDLITSLRDDYFDENGAPRLGMLSRKSREVHRFVESGGIDTFETRKAIANKMRSKKVNDAYTAYVAELSKGVIKDKKLRLDSGKLVPYEIERVVAVMVKQLRGGENWNYGAGNLRAQYAAELKNRKAVQNRRDEIVSGEAFAKIRDESNDKLIETLELLKPYYKFGADGWGYTDDASTAIGEGPRGLREVFNMGAEAQAIVDDFVGYLRSVPTEYFEIKMQRAMSLSEFAGAVVPRGTPKDITDKLKAEGVKVKTYDPKAEGGRTKAIESFKNLLFQNGAQPRGTFAPNQNLIKLLAGADLSTYLHESGHFYLHALSQIAAAPDAPAEIKADMQTVLEFMGVPDLDTWHSMSLDEQRDGHEKFARAFELYMFEGKTPAPGMSGLFNRFSAWMRRVYRSVTQLNVELTDEVRGVMDRMLASEDDIKAAQAERRVELDPNAAEALRAGMTALEWAEYQALAKESTDEAVNELQRRRVRDMQWLRNARSKLLKGMQAEAKEKRAAIEAEVRLELEKQPVYAARKFFKTGEVLRDGETVQVQTGHKLLISAVQDMYPKGSLDAPDWKKLGYGKAGMLSKEAGMHPDVFAPMFGFRDGDAMVREILDAPPIQELIDANTDSLMFERYGDLTDEQAMQRAIDQALANKAKAKMIAAELRALAKANRVNTAKGAGGTVNAIVAEAKRYAAAMIGRRKVRDLRVSEFARAGAKAAQAANKALGKGDTEAAALHKRNQLVHHHAVRAVNDARSEVEKGVRYLKKFASPGVRKKLDIEYVDQIDALLELYDLRQASQNQVRKRKALAEWIDSQMAQGFTPDIDPKLVNQARKQHYSQLSVDDFRALVDAVRNIEHIGRLKQTLLTAKDQREFKLVVEELTAHIEGNSKNPQPVPREANRFSDRLKSGVKEFFAMHRKLASLVREMDGWQDGGLFWELFVRPMNKAGDNEAAARAKATTELNEIFRPIFASGKLKDKMYIKGIGASLSREARLAVALNWGNEANRQRVMDGENWTIPQAYSVLETLTEAEWEFVQKVWDHIDSYWPAIAEQERKLTGAEPGKVEASKFDNGKGKMMRGGYYPIKYDQRRSTAAEEHNAADLAKQALQGVFTRAATRKGHTKARVEHVERAPRLDLGVIFEHVDQVIHTLSWQEWLIDANRLLGNDDVKNVIREGYGPEVLKVMRDAVRDIATGEQGAQNAWERGLNHLRTGATVAGLGWSMSTALLQPIGLTQSMVRIGPKWVGKGLARWLGDAARMEGGVKWVQEKSEFMKGRAATMNREINEIQNRVRSESKTAEALNISFFYLIQKFQMVADMPTWLGAYEKSMATGAHEETAIALADQAVIDAQTGGQVKDLAAIQRGGPALKLFTNFYSFFSATFNLMAEATGRADKRSPLAIGRLAVDYLLLLVIPAILGDFMKAALTGELWDEDGDELLERAARANLGYASGMMIGVREMSSVIAGFNNYGGPAGARFFGELTKLLGQAQQGEVDAAALKALNNTAGVLFHYPAGQVQRTVSGIEAMVSGDTANPMALMLGPPK